MKNINTSILSSDGYRHFIGSRVPSNIKIKTRFNKSIKLDTSSKLQNSLFSIRRSRRLNDSPGQLKNYSTNISNSLSPDQAAVDISASDAKLKQMKDEPINSNQTRKTKMSARADTDRFQLSMKLNDSQRLQD